MRALAADAWLLMGDFNLICGASNKNNNNINQPLCDLFNSTLDTLVLLEIPLLDRKFTWSNLRANPTLERIDRVFFNLDMNELFPNSSISSQVRQISDHTPLLLQLSSTIPKASTFRFENS
jgi:endonuclease/exonuclease/phosphatase family metal-dependent hydrolase